MSTATSASTGAASVNSSSDANSDTSRRPTSSHVGRSNPSEKTRSPGLTRSTGIFFSARSANVGPSITSSPASRHASSSRTLSPRRSSTATTITFAPRARARAASPIVSTEAQPTISVCPSRAISACSLSAACAPSPTRNTRARSAVMRPTSGSAARSASATVHAPPSPATAIARAADGPGIMSVPTPHTIVVAPIALRRRAARGASVYATLKSYRSARYRPPCSAAVAQAASTSMRNQSAGMPRPRATVSAVTTNAPKSRICSATKKPSLRDST